MMTQVREHKWTDVDGWPFCADCLISRSSPGANEACTGLSDMSPRHGTYQLTPLQMQDTIKKLKEENADLNDQISTMQAAGALMIEERDAATKEISNLKISLDQVRQSEKRMVREANNTHRAIMVLHGEKHLDLLRQMTEIMAKARGE